MEAGGMRSSRSGRGGKTLTEESASATMTGRGAGSQIRRAGSAALRKGKSARWRALERAGSAGSVKPLMAELQDA